MQEWRILMCSNGINERFQTDLAIKTIQMAEKFKFQISFFLHVQRSGEQSARRLLNGAQRAKLNLNTLQIA